MSFSSTAAAGSEVCECVNAKCVGRHDNFSNAEKNRPIYSTLSPVAVGKKQTRGSRSDRRHKERTYRSKAKLSGSVENPPPPKETMGPGIKKPELNHRE